MPLTAKQQRFVDEFLVDLNQTQAALRAGYSERTAYSIGNELLKKPEIAEAIEAAKTKRSESVGIDAAWLLTRLAAEAEADVADLYDEDGNLKPVRQWPKIWRQGLVAGVEIEDKTEEGFRVGHIKKVRLSDRVKRLELIGKHIGVKAFEETIRVKGLEGLGERLARAAQRLKDGE